MLQRSPADLIRSRQWPGLRGQGRRSSILRGLRECRMQATNQNIRFAGRIPMLHRSSTGAFAVVAALMVTIGVAPAADDANTPIGKASGTPSTRVSEARP